MRAREIRVPNWYDRLICGWLHRPHTYSVVAGLQHRRCHVFGCSMLVVRELPLAKVRRKARESAAKVIRSLP